MEYKHGVCVTLSTEPIVQLTNRYSTPSAVAAAARECGFENVQMHVKKESDVPHLTGMIDKVGSAAISSMLETCLREERDIKGDSVSDESIREQAKKISETLDELVGDRIHWRFSWGTVICRK
jgi:hypothetical protein